MQATWSRPLYITRADVIIKREGTRRPFFKCQGRGVASVRRSWEEAGREDAGPGRSAPRKASKQAGRKGKHGGSNVLCCVDCRLHRLAFALHSRGDTKAGLSCGSHRSCLL